MPQSLANILIHLIFSTKERYPFLTPEIRPQLHAYAGTVLNGLDSPAIIINSVDDHVHALMRLSKNHAVCDVVQDLKTSTSKWLKRQSPDLAGFHWQNGYGAFSVSQSKVEAVKEYIAGQEAHHRRTTFEEEFRAFLKKHAIEFEEKHVWD